MSITFWVDNQTPGNNVNFANANAWRFTKLFTPDGEGDYCGTIKAAEIDTAISKLLKDMTVSFDRRGVTLLNVLAIAKYDNKDVHWG